MFRFRPGTAERGGVASAAVHGDRWRGAASRTPAAGQNRLERIEKIVQLEMVAQLRQIEADVLCRNLESVAAAAVVVEERDALALPQLLDDALDVRMRDALFLDVDEAAAARRIANSLDGEDEQATVHFGRHRATFAVDFDDEAV